jgi:hypothetical protein
MTELTHHEQELIEVYDRLAQIVKDHGDELAPFQRANATKALAALWQIANGLDRDPGNVYELGV